MAASIPVAQLVRVVIGGNLYMKDEHICGPLIWQKEGDQQRVFFCAE